jgi:hypothetical protein
MPTPRYMAWRMRIAHGDPYRPMETIGEAEPTITRPNTHNTTIRMLSAVAVRIRAKKRGWTTAPAPLRSERVGTDPDGAPEPAASVRGPPARAVPVREGGGGGVTVRGRTALDGLEG